MGWFFQRVRFSHSLLTAILFKDARDSYQIFAQKADYLWSQDDSLEWWNAAKRTMECTRPMLKAGQDGLFERYIDRSMKMTNVFAGMIREGQDFELLVEP